MSTLTPRFERLLTTSAVFQKQSLLEAVKKRLAPAVVVRVLADVGLLNIALIFGLFVRNLIVHDAQNSLVAVATVFFHASMFLSTMGPVIFGAMGYYTKGRFYASRYKAVAILQATALLFVVFGFSNFLLGSHEFSRLAVMITWVVAVS